MYIIGLLSIIPSCDQWTECGV